MIRPTTMFDKIAYRFILPPPNFFLSGWHLFSIHTEENPVVHTIPLVYWHIPQRKVLPPVC